MTNGQNGRLHITFCLLLALGFNIAFWQVSRDTFARWSGVPPVPTKQGAQAMSLGDSQFSFRFWSITLQHLGDTGGQVIPLKDYDYGKLSEWFFLLHDLDPASDQVPMVAAYYFGGTMVPKDVGEVVRYLAAVGENPLGSKWRWMAHAVFLARHRMDDLQLALDLAYRLSRLQPVGDTLPAWARQMPAFVLKETGGEEGSRQFMVDLLLSSENFHPNEVSFMKSYLVDQLGMPSDEVDRLIALRGNRDTVEEWEAAPRLPAPMP